MVLICIIIKVSLRRLIRVPIVFVSFFLRVYISIILKFVFVRVVTCLDLFDRSNVFIDRLVGIVYLSVIFKVLFNGYFIIYLSIYFSMIICLFFSVHVRIVMNFFCSSIVFLVLVVVIDVITYYLSLCVRSSIRRIIGLLCSCIGLKFSISCFLISLVLLDVLCCIMICCVVLFTVLNVSKIFFFSVYRECILFSIFA